MVLVAAIQPAGAAGAGSAGQTGGAAAAASQSIGTSLTEADIAEATRRITLGMMALQRHDGEAALRELDAAIALPGLAGVSKLMHFDAFVYKGIAEGMKGDPEAGYVSLQRAAAYAPEFRDFTYWITVVAITSRIDRLDEGVEAALALVRDFPDQVDTWGPSVSSMLMMSRDLRDSPARLELLERLWRMDFAPSGSEEAGEVLMRELLALYADRREDEPALELIAQLHRPASLAVLRFDARFARYAASNKLGGYALAQEQALRQAKERAAAQPRDLSVLNELARLLRDNARADEALTLLDGAIERTRAAGAGSAAFDDVDENLQWTFAGQADVLMTLGRPEEALVAMQAAVDAAKRDPTVPLVSQWINQAGFLFRAGKGEEALRVLDQVDLDETAPCGAMAVSATKVCAREQMGDSAGGRPALEFVLAHATDSYRSVKLALLCSDEADELARQVIAMLDNPTTRGDVLEDVQTYLTPPNRTPYVRLLDDRFEIIKARPDVQAAIAKYGKVLSWPIYGPWS